jgi:hypothetical protein
MKNICFAAAALFISIHVSIVQAQIPGLTWVSSVGGAGNTSGGKIGLDAAGSVYTAGTFDNTTDFDPGAGVNNLTSAGNSDIYIQKLDAAGNYLWAIAFGGQGSDFVNSMDVDAAGNVYIAGMFSDTVDFDPGAGVNSIAAAGSYDGFYMKLDASGGLVWVRTTQGLNFESVEDIRAGASGIYITGYFTGTVDFDAGAGVATQVSNGSTDGFIQKVDASGNFVWVRAVGGTGMDRGLKLVTDAADNVYVAGGFEATVDLDPGVGIANTTSSGGEDGFVLKLDGSGNTVFTRSFGGSAEEYITSMTMDISGNIFLGGGFFGTSDLDPGAGNYAVTSNGARDMFVSKLNASGNFVWAAAAGGSGYEHIGSLSTDGAGNLYATGSFSGTIDFDPDAGTYNLQSTGINPDIYLFKLDAAGSLVWAAKIGGSDADITYDIETDASLNIYLAGFFIGTVDFDPSPAVYNHTSNNLTDAMVIKLNQCNTYATTNQTSCGSYTWNSTAYTASGTYTQVVPNAAGCDSVMTLNLTILNTSSQQSITACGNYTWQNITYTASGTYMDTLTNAAGCDSILTLNLVINQYPDTSVTASGSTLTANANGISYLWINCANGNFIPAGQSYTATANGSYAVIVTQNGCTDTSSCYSIVITGLDEVNSFEGIVLSPNPNNGTFTFTANAEGTYSIVNSLGQVVHSFDLHGPDTVTISDMSEGVYFLVSSEEKLGVKKIVVVK